MRTLMPALANRLWQCSAARSAFRFRQALDHAATEQSKRLLVYLRDNADTEIGRRYRFDAIHDVDAYRAHVPLHDYDDLADAIDRIRTGQPRVLTREPVIRLMPSSGSTRAAKLIPYTASLQREFNDAVAPWITDLFRTHPDLRNGCAYWSITPSVLRNDLSSRIPIGYEDDSAYLGGWMRRLIGSVVAVPDAVAHIEEIATLRHVTLLLLLRRPDLRLISVWHPSFLTLLLETLTTSWDALLDDLRTGGCSVKAGADPDLLKRLPLAPDPRRADQLKHAPCDPLRIWPRLRAISCWGDANAAAAAQALAERFPGVCVQHKGLLATEAFISIPYAGRKVLAVRSHFVEFLEADDRSRLPHQVDTGGEYTLAVTTAGGLYRYRLRDRVRITGRLGAAPTFDFLGKEDQISDHFGEKLSEGFVSGILDRLGLRASFRLLAPDAGPHGFSYTLFADAVPDVPHAANTLDSLLSANPHYRHCRALGQLVAPRIFVIAGNAFATYADVLRAAGQRIGDIKPAALSSRTDWARHFSGRYLD